MPLNEVTMRVQDGGLGLSAPSTDRIHVKLGCAAAGDTNVLETYAEATTVRTRLARGPLARALGHALGATTLGRGTGPILAMRVAQATPGFCGPVRKAAAAGGTGTGVVTVTGAAVDRFVVRLQLVATGTVGTARARYSLDDGATWSGEFVVPASGEYTLPDTHVTVAFNEGAGPVFYEAGDVFHFRTVAPAHDAATRGAAFAALRAGTHTFFLVHVVGPPAPALSAVVASGTNPPGLTVTGTPADWWPFRVVITRAGERGVATFRYSLDDGATDNGEDLPTAANYAVPETGVTLHFASSGPHATDHAYSFDSGNAAELTTLYNTVKGEMEDLLTEFRYAGAVVEAPDAPDRALVTVANTLVDSPLMSIAGGFCATQNDLDQRVEKRSVAWPIVARLAAIPPGEQAARKAAKALARVTGLYRDERVTPALDAAGFMTLRTVIGRTGYWIEKTPMRRDAASDCRGWVERRILDVLQRVGRDALLEWQGEDFRVEAATGFILEEDAVRVDESVGATVRAALRGQVSAVTVATVRTTNLITTELLEAKFTAQPLGYANSIRGTVALARVLPST